MLIYESGKSAELFGSHENVVEISFFDTALELLSIHGMFSDSNNELKQHMISTIRRVLDLDFSKIIFPNCINNECEIEEGGIFHGKYRYSDQLEQLEIQSLKMRNNVILDYPDDVERQKCAMRYVLILQAHYKLSTDILFAYKMYSECVSKYKNMEITEDEFDSKTYDTRQWCNWLSRAIRNFHVDMLSAKSDYVVTELVKWEAE